MKTSVSECSVFGAPLVLHQVRVSAGIMAPCPIGEAMAKPKGRIVVR
jgi:hypothetical protein